MTADGRRADAAARQPAARRCAPGAGGLRTTRFELALSAPRARAASVVLRDDTFPGRVGWNAIVAQPGEGTAVRSTVPATDPTRGLTRYPKDALSSPADIRSARLDARPGDGTVSAPGPDANGATADAAPSGTTTRTAAARTASPGLFADAAAGEGVLLFLLLAAFGWGAVHALSPGHGKAMVAAYLVGTRGTARHAAALGATVTVTHTAGVLLLGVVTLTLSAVHPARAPVSVAEPGLRAARRDRRRAPCCARARGGGGRPMHHATTPPRPRAHSHAPEDLSTRGILAMGASAGLIPCPSALVVLLGAVAQHQLALGLVMIVAFSLGLAATLTVLGIAVVHATHLPMPGRIAAVLPTVSAR